MYHISNDLRAKKSAEKIYRSLRHILFNKSIEHITITDIKNECGVSRATFYRLFDNVIDVLEMKMDYFILLYKKDLLQSQDHISTFYNFWNNHSDFIYILSKQQEHILKKLFIKHFYQTSYNKLDVYLFEVQISVMTGLLSKWVERGKQETVDEMIKITKQILNNTLKLLF